MQANESAPDTGAGEVGPASEQVTISRAELDDLRARAEAAASNVRGTPREEPGASDREARGREQEARLISELTARDEKVRDLERTCKEAVRDRELATQLAGRSLVPGAATQLLKLWRDEFDVYEEGGAYKVVARDGRAPTQVVGERLSSADYSHFCLPTSRGGTGARDASRPSQAGPQADGPKNLGEAVVMRWREESATRPSSLIKPIGLRRHR